MSLGLSAGCLARGASLAGLLAATLVLWWCPLEALATDFTVDSATDAGDAAVGDNSCAVAGGGCTLRAAIQEANATAAKDRVKFAVGAGAVTVSPQSALPQVTAPLDIDGTTQPGFVAAPIVELSGSAAGPLANGLVITGGDSLVRGLVINRFGGVGVFLTLGGGNRVLGNYVGTNAAGDAAAANKRVGVEVLDSPNNRIGGAAVADRNVISGNGGGTAAGDGSGVAISGAQSIANQVTGNYVGTRADGTQAVPNAGDGVLITSPNGPASPASDTVVGGSVPGAGNVTAGNGGSGVAIVDAPRTHVAGNRIGLDASGGSLGNAGDGVVAQSAPDTTVGIADADSDERNVVSANAGNGIVLVGDGADRAVIRGNYIGTNADGSAAAVDNSGATVNRIGVLLADNQPDAPGGGATGTKIGGQGVQGNVIAGNRIGIRVFQSATDTEIAGNLIGTDATGSSDVGNAQDGVHVWDSADNRISAGLFPERRNVISGNDRYGVRLEGSGATGNVVKGNLVGTRADGAGALGNGSDGVRIESGASGNRVGVGLAADETCDSSDCNRIRHNGGAGIEVVGNASLRNTIAGNSVAANGGLGIDLGSPGVTPNDAGDAATARDGDAGPNSLVNFPVGVSAYRDRRPGGVTSVSGMIDTPSPETTRVDVYGVDAVDASGFGEGVAYLGWVLPRPNGHFSLAISPAEAARHPFYSATVTDADGSTSELSPVCGDPDGTGDPDNDDDGLCDSWELQGVDFDGDGNADLPLDRSPYSANPDRKDVYVEVDYMSAQGGFDPRPERAALEDVTAAFANAPGGFPGIALHLTPDVPGMVDEEVGAIDPIATGGSGAGTFRRLKDGDPAKPCDGSFGRDADRQQADCASRLGAKRLVYRYALFGHQFSESLGSSGRGELPGDELIVTLGAWSAADFIVDGGGRGTCKTLFRDDCRRIVEAGTFMHELGHTLGLFHGGGDSDQYKPNYLSVMNYAFQVARIAPDRPLDYSRWQLPQLNENALVDASGIDGGAPPPGLADWPHTAFTFYDGTPTSPSFDTCRYQTAATIGPIDWDRGTGVQDGINDPDLGSNAGALEACQVAANKKTLTGFDDWSHLYLSPRGVPTSEFGSGLPLDPAEVELTQAQAEADAAAADADLDGVSNADDNCTTVANSDQADADGDGIGDACPTGGPGPGGGSPGGNGAGVPQPRDTTGPAMAVLGARLNARGVIGVRLRCLDPEPCTGTLRLDTAQPVSVRRARRRPVLLGRKSLGAASGRVVVVRVALSRHNRLLMERLRRPRVTATVRAHDPAGNTAVTRRTLRLQRAGRRRAGA